jgi:Lrp/AsnC family transcriptional regulator, leucine-responsive regulatory protein
MDNTDRRLLQALQRDGRITNVDLAKQAHLSPAACFERVKRLQRDGYIARYTALLDAGKVDRGLLIFVEIVLEKMGSDIFDEFAKAARRQPEILECHIVAGGFDYLIKVRVKNMNAYRRFLGDVLIRLPGVRETHTYAVMEEVKNTTELAF